MKENIINSVKIIFSNNLNNIDVSTNLQTLIFKGFKILDEKENYFNIEDIKILKQNEKVNYQKINFEYYLEHVPSCYNEQKLIKTLEKLGIGRPSTFAYIVDIIQKRDYVIKTDIKGKTLEVEEFQITNEEKFIFNSIKKEKTFFNEFNKLIPTEKGKRLIEFMKEYFSYIIDYEYTSKIESELDKIANKEVRSLDVLNDFWNNLDSHLIEYKKKQKENKKQNESRDIGTFENQRIILKNGVYGFYTTFKGKNKSIKIDKEFEEITLDDIKEFLVEEKNNNIIGEYLGKKIELFKGPFGFYFVYNDKNYKSNGIEEIEDEKERLEKCIEIINQTIKEIEDKETKKEYKVLKSLKKENSFYINVYKIEKSKNKYFKTIFIKNKNLQEDLKGNIENINLEFIKKIEKETKIRK